MMRTSFVALLVAALAVVGCSKNTEEAVQFQVGELAETEGEALQDGDSVVRPVGDSEGLREAMLVILKGIPSPPADEPLKFGLVKSVDAEMYMDIDDGDGPEQWITIAEVVDADGNVLWTDRVNTLYQLLRYLELVLDQQSNVNFSMSQVFGFVNMQYPQLLEFGVRVPLGIEGASEYVLRIPKNDGTYYEAFRADIAELAENREPSDLTGEAKLLIDNGPADDTIDIVILGDGYTAEEKERFEKDAEAIADRLNRNEPFTTKIKDFNVHSIWTPSNESGAGYDCTGIITADNGCKKDLRDTQFEMVFVITALIDRFNLALEQASARVAMPLQVGRLFQAASTVPFDEIIMVSNTRRSSGFAGLYVSVLTAYDGRIGFPDTAVHELGHSFGILGDEYNIEGDPCLDNEPAIPLPPNIASVATYGELKWNYMLEPDTPLPTSQGEAETGAFAGAYNCDHLYRPSHQCKMRDSDLTFCEVCSEQLVNRIYAYVDAVPPNSEASVTREGNELVFRVPTRSEEIGVTWLLGDDEEEVGNGPELRLASDKVPTSTTRLRAKVYEASQFIIGDKPSTYVELDWWVSR